MLNLFRKTETIRDIIIDDIKYSISGKQVKFLIEKLGKKFTRTLFRGDYIQNTDTNVIFCIDRVEDGSIIFSGIDNNDFEIPEALLDRRGNFFSITNDIL